MGFADHEDEYRILSGETQNLIESTQTRKERTKKPHTLFIFPTAAAENGAEWLEVFQGLEGAMFTDTPPPSVRVDSSRILHERTVGKTTLGVVCNIATQLLVLRSHGDPPKRLKFISRLVDDLLQTTELTSLTRFGCWASVYILIQCLNVGKQEASRCKVVFFLVSRHWLSWICARYMGLYFLRVHKLNIPFSSLQITNSSPISSLLSLGLFCDSQSLLLSLGKCRDWPGSSPGSFHV